MSHDLPRVTDLSNLYPIWPELDHFGDLHNVGFSWNASRGTENDTGLEIEGSEDEFSVIPTRSSRFRARTRCAPQTTIAVDGKPEEIDFA